MSDNCCSGCVGDRLFQAAGAAYENMKGLLGQILSAWLCILKTAAECSFLFVNSEMKRCDTSFFIRTASTVCGVWGRFSFHGRTAALLLSQDVRALNEEISAEESRYHYISMMRSILENQMERINTEMKLYVSTNAADKKKSFR